MTKARPGLVLLLMLAALACSPAEEPSEVKPAAPAAPVDSDWALTNESRDLVADSALEQRIYQALDAAAGAGTDPSISKYDVRAATVVPHEGEYRAIVGGNTEWFGYPEAIHGETSLLNHVINHVGPEAARRDVDFLVFYKDGQCGVGGSCGDCRDYLMTTTRWQDLLMVCGSGADHSVHVSTFAQWIVPEADFPETTAEEIDLGQRLDSLVVAARRARDGGVALFTPAEQHLGVAALSTEGRIYRAAGADDAAFHYRYPIGAVLQQAAAHSDYFIDAIVVTTAPGHIPRISYRDRQYGYESSSFNGKRGHGPIRLILVEEADAEQRAAGAPWLSYRLTTFEEALPGAFSTASFMPDAVDEFLATRAEE